MKAVMLSIKPKYCELIVLGLKTVELRKTKPKIETPFKCYIYCTKDKTPFLLPTYSKGNLTDSDIWQKGNGKIIGEFVCDKITTYPYEQLNDGEHIMPFGDLEKTCLDGFEIYNYLGNKDGYGWHISDLIIYDKPKELSEFYTLCSEYKREHITSKCGRCRHISFNEFDRCLECDCKGEKKLTRPPQSWCYVEE